MRHLALGILCLLVVGSCGLTESVFDDYENFLVDVRVFRSANSYQVSVLENTFSQELISEASIDSVSLQQIGAWWTHNFASIPTGDVVLEVTSLEGSQAVAELATPPSIELPIVAEVNRDQDLVITWIGEPLGTREWVVAYVSDGLGTKVNSLYVDSAPGTVTIPKGRLQQLSPNSFGIVELERNFEVQPVPYNSMPVSEVEYRYIDFQVAEIL